MKREINTMGWLFLNIGLMISPLLTLTACRNKVEIFYDKVRVCYSCMIPCKLQYQDKVPILYVTEKYNLLNLFRENNVDIDEEILIQHIKNNIPIQICEKMYTELYPYRILPNPSIDSLANLSINNLLVVNENGEISVGINVDDWTDKTISYGLKVLFDHKILVKSTPYGYVVIPEKISVQEIKSDSMIILDDR